MNEFQNSKTKVLEMRGAEGNFTLSNKLELETLESFFEQKKWVVIFIDEKVYL